MPVLSTDINVFSARTNGFLAILTAIGKPLVIAGDTSWLSFNGHKSLLWQGLITEVTAEVTRMPILIHGLGVLTNIDQLWKVQNNHLMRLYMSHGATRTDNDDDDNTDNELSNKIECVIPIHLPLWWASQLLPLTQLLCTWKLAIWGIYEIV